MSQRLGLNLGTGVRWGLYYAAVYSAVGTVLYVLRGPDLLAGYGLTFVEMLASYVAGGLVGGVVVGLFLPMGRTAVGAALLGFIAVLPFCFAAALTMTEPAQWSSEIPLVPLVTAALLGPLSGLGTWIYRSRY